MSDGRTFAALSDAVLAIAAETEPAAVLARLADTVRELADATYSAIGVPDGHGGFSRFVTSGMSEEVIEAIGPLPKQHGLLAATLESSESFRTPDIRSDPRFEYWPKAHPDMTSFMGVPISAGGAVVGAFYLADKRSDDAFTEHDQQLVELFAAHAAVAIEQSSLRERTRELSVIEERNRLARDLHDSLAQTLFSLSLTAEAATTLAASDVDAAAAEMKRVSEIAREALAQLRSIVFELRPADLDAEGLAATISKHGEVLSRVHGQHITVETVSEGGLSSDVELELFRITQEAISNVLKHAGASKVTVSLDLDAGRLSITDDGRGFDPTDALARAGHLGLTSMEERASAVGGKAVIESAPGRGTTVTVTVPT